MKLHHADLLKYLWKEPPNKILVRTGVLTNEEVLEEVKAVRREMEGKRGR